MELHNHIMLLPYIHPAHWFYNQSIYLKYQRELVLYIFAI